MTAWLDESNSRRLRSALRALSLLALMLVATFAGVIFWKIIRGPLPLESGDVVLAGCRYDTERQVVSAGFYYRGPNHLLGTGRVEADIEVRDQDDVVLGVATMDFPGGWFNPSAHAARTRFAIGPDTTEISCSIQGSPRWSDR